MMVLASPAEGERPGRPARAPRATDAPQEVPLGTENARPAAGEGRPCPVPEAAPLSRPHPRRALVAFRPPYSTFAPEEDHEALAAPARNLRRGQDAAGGEGLGAGEGGGAPRRDGGARP